MKNTFLIRVALASRDPEEAALIVNAVVDAYLEQHGEYHRSANKALRKSLEDEKNMLEMKIAEKKKELKALFETGHIAMKRPEVNSNASKKDDAGIHPALATVTEEQFTKVTDRLIQADLDLIDARVRLEQAEPRADLAKDATRRTDRGEASGQSMNWRLPSKKRRGSGLATRSTSKD